jgi:hypothetical protein
MNHPPLEATSQQTYLEDINRQIAAAHSAGGYTAVLELAQEKQLELQREFAELTAGHELRTMASSELEELRRTWTPDKARLTEQITELREQLRGWGFIEDQVRGFAANEAHGWDILPDGTCAKVQENGKVLSAHGYVSEFTDSDGTVYASDGPDQRWIRRHQRHVREFGDRVRGERLATARQIAPIGARRRGRREHRPGSTRRTASSSSTSSADPGDPDPEPEPPGGLQHVSIPLAAELNRIADRLRARGGVG